MPEDKKIQSFQMRMPMEIKNWITRKAKNNDRSINAELVRLLRQAKELEETNAA